MQGGFGILSRSSADFVGADPFPGVGTFGSVQLQEFLIPNVYIVAPLTTELSFGLAIDAPVRLGPALEHSRDLAGPFHLAERGHQDDRPERELLLQALSRALDRGRGGLPVLGPAARAQRRRDRPVHAVGRGRRAHQALQRPDVQRRLGLQRRDHVEADPGDRRRRVVPEQDHGGLRGDGDRHPAVHGQRGLRRARRGPVPLRRAPRDDLDRLSRLAQHGRRPRPRRRLPGRARGRLDGVVELQVPEHRVSRRRPSRARPRHRSGRIPGPTASASRRSSATGRSASATTTTTRRSPRRTSARSSRTTTATSTRAASATTRPPGAWTSAAPTSCSRTGRS